MRVDHHHTCFFPTVVAGRAKPQQPGQQPGCTALSGEQEGVREEGDGHRGAELGGRLSFLSHHPLIIIQYFILSFLPHQVKKNKKEKTATISKELKCHPKKGINQPPREQPKWERTLTCLPTHLRKTREETNVCFLILLLLLHDVK